MSNKCDRPGFVVKPRWFGIRPLNQEWAQESYTPTGPHGTRRLVFGQWSKPPVSMWSVFRFDESFRFPWFRWIGVERERVLDMCHMLFAWMFIPDLHMIDRYWYFQLETQLKSVIHQGFVPSLAQATGTRRRCQCMHVICRRLSIQGRATQPGHVLAVMFLFLG